MQESEKWKWSRSVVSNSLWPHGLQLTRLLRPWDFTGKSTRVGCHCLLHNKGHLTLIHFLNEWLGDKKAGPILPFSRNKWKSCLTLCNPMDYTVHGILQARILEWVAVPISRGSSQRRDQTQVSHIAGRFFTSWATRKAQEYCSGWPIPSPVDLPNPGIELGSSELKADSLPTELSGKHLLAICPSNKLRLNTFRDNKI